MKNFWQKLDKPIIALAPMAGITDSAFRLICKKYGADVVYSEMVSAEGLYYGRQSHSGRRHLQMSPSEALLKFNKREKPIVIQLFGKNPEAFAGAAALVSKLGVDGIDINFGCPARKVFGHGGGASLMNQPELARRIIKNVIDNTNLPVSIKFRARVKGVTAMDFLKKIGDLPISVIMIHGRTYEQGFSGPVDYEMIKKVKQNFKGVVLANGGIKIPEDVKVILEKTGADGVGLAQGVLGKPWLFQQIKDYFKKGKYKELDFNEIKKIALEHAKLAYKLKPDKAPYEMRKHLGWYFKGFEGAGELRKKLVKTNSLKEIVVILEGAKRPIGSRFALVQVS